jgi:hypothetical protein
MEDFNFMPTLEIFQWGEVNEEPKFRFEVEEIMSDDDKGKNIDLYSPFPIDTDKLMNYIVPHINYR